MTIAEITAIVSCSVAVSGLILTVARFWISRAEKRCSEQLKTTRSDLLRAIASNILRQFESVDKTTFVTLDYRMDGVTNCLRIPLAYDRVTEPLQGLRLQLQEHDKTCSKYSISTLGHHQPVRLHWHYHEEAEVINVLEGRVIDVETGRSYAKGETWAISPGRRHIADFDNAFALATVRPPLPLASEVPPFLGGIETVYDAAEPNPQIAA